MSDPRGEADGPPAGGAVDGRRADEAPADRPLSEALLIPEALRERLHRHVEDAYPREGCGVLLGEVADGARRVTGLEPAENRWPDRDDRYLVDPETLRRLMEEEENGGPRVLGFYHSHPDAPPEPSKTDLEHAWPWYHYLIVGVRGGRAGAGRVWELEEDAFAERELRNDRDPG